MEKYTVTELELRAFFYAGSGIGWASPEREKRFQMELDRLTPMPKTADLSRLKMYDHGDAFYYKCDEVTALVLPILPSLEEIEDVCMSAMKQIECEEYGNVWELVMAHEEPLTVPRAILGYLTGRLW